MKQARIPTDIERMIVKEVFSLNARQSDAAIAALGSLDADARLKAYEAILTQAGHDSKTASLLTWILALALPFVFSFLGPRTDQYQAAVQALGMIWEIGVLGGIAVSCLIRAGFEARQKALAQVLELADDTRLISSLLDYQRRAATRIGVESAGYRTAVAALERLLPLVSAEAVAEWPQHDREKLRPLLRKAQHPKLTIELLRLIIAYGDESSLKPIDQLASQYDWGGMVDPELCEPLHDAAVASASTLRTILNGEVQQRTLLRASDAFDDQNPTELLRSTSGIATLNSDELLRPELQYDVPPEIKHR